MRFPAHSAGSTSTRTKAVSSRLGGGREHGMVCAFVPRLAGAVRLDAVGRVDGQLAVEQAADARAGMNVAVRDAPRGEVDPVAAENPLTRTGIVGQLPDERVAVNARCPGVRLVAREVVDDAVPRFGLDAVRMLRQLEDQ